MARKDKTVTITAEGRDKGKIYYIKEEPCSKVEKWFLRLLMLAAQYGGFAGSPYGGAAAFVSAGLRSIIAGVPFEQVEALLDEMMSCVQAVPDPKRTMLMRSLVEDDIEEVATRWELRREVAELHLGFSLDVVLTRLSPPEEMSQAA